MAARRRTAARGCGTRRRSGGDWPAGSSNCAAAWVELVHAELDARRDGAPDALARVNALAAVPPPGVRAVRGAHGGLVRTLEPRARVRRAARRRGPGRHRPAHRPRAHGPCFASARATPAGCSTSTPRAGADVAGARARRAATASGWPGTGAASPRSDGRTAAAPRKAPPALNGCGQPSVWRDEPARSRAPGWSRPGGAGCARMPPWPMTVREGPSTAPCPTRS